MTRKLAAPFLASLLLASFASAAPAVPASLTPETDDFASIFSPAPPDCGEAKAKVGAPRPGGGAKSAFYCGSCSPSAFCRGLPIGYYCSGLQKTCQPLAECSATTPEALRCICSSITP